MTGVQFQKALSGQHRIHLLFPNFNEVLLSAQHFKHQVYNFIQIIVWELLDQVVVFDIFFNLLSLSLNHIHRLRLRRID